MLFDIVLPLVISLVTITIVWLYPKFETKMKPLLEEQEFRVRDAVFLVIAMGIMITIIALVPSQAIKVLFLAAYSFALFFFTYILVDRWYFAVLPPIIFVALYLSSFWNVVLLNVFAIIFAMFISLYLGGLFSWKTVSVFSVLIIIMDVIQVFATGFMGDAASKFIELELPVLIQVRMFPVERWIGLGLGDIFLAGLLAIQTAQKRDRKAGIIAAISIGFAFLLFEIFILNYEFTGYFPATLVVVGGWLLGLGLHYFVKQKIGS